jgi:hypothetical protein
MSQEDNSQSSQSESEELDEEEDETDEMNASHSSTREPQDLDNTLKRARDADRLKGQAVAKQLVCLA